MTLWSLSACRVAARPQTQVCLPDNEVTPDRLPLTVLTAVVSCLPGQWWQECQCLLVEANQDHRLVIDLSRNSILQAEQTQPPADRALGLAATSAHQ